DDGDRVEGAVAPGVACGTASLEEGGAVEWAAEALSELVEGRVDAGVREAPPAPGVVSGQHGAEPARCDQVLFRSLRVDRIKPSSILSFSAGSAFALCPPATGRPPWRPYCRTARAGRARGTGAGDG